MGKTLAKPGDIVKDGDTLKSSDLSIIFKMDMNVLLTDCFKKLPDVVDVRINEVTNIGDDVEKEWVIQMKFKTTKSKLNKIELFLRQNLEDLI
jgi:hypothetical protein